MQRLKGRLDRLERILNPMPAPRKFFRLLVNSCGSLDLANSTCQRTPINGTLKEVVILDGNQDHINDEQLESLLKAFPFQGGAVAW